MPVRIAAPPDEDRFTHNMILRNKAPIAGIKRDQTIEVGKIPAVILVRDGSLIPHVPLAQRTDEIDWNAIDLKPYQADAKSCTGLLFKPGDKALQVITK